MPSFLKYFLAFLLMYSMAAYSQANRYAVNSVMHPPPEPDFGWTNACLGDSTHFYNATIRASTYTWTVIDSSGSSAIILDTSHATNITYLFPSVGVYYIMLEADNGHHVSVTKTLVIDTVTTVDFSYMRCSNVFSNMSTCASAFYWDFGDGDTSSAAIPVHQYADTGTYVVTLIAYGSGSTDTIRKSITINATHFASPVFTYYQSNDSIYFHAPDTDPYMAYYWNFGDGTNATGRDTVHVYPAPGIYTVGFIVQNGCGYSINSDTIMVQPVMGLPGMVVNNFVRGYPNPLKQEDIFILEIFCADPGKKELELCDLLGQPVKMFPVVQQQGMNRWELAFAGISPGSYFLRIGVYDILKVCVLAR